MRFDLSEKSPLYGFMALDFAILVLVSIIGTVSISQEKIRDRYDSDLEVSHDIESEAMTLSHYINKTAAADNTSFKRIDNATIYVYNATLDDATGNYIFIEKPNYTVIESSGYINLTTGASYDEIGVIVNYTYVLTTDPTVE